MSNQETFDLVVAHARKQGCKAEVVLDRNGGTECLYRGPGGTRCFVGCLIPDNRYEEDMEGDAVGSDEHSFGPVAQLMESLGHDVKLLEVCQEIHDNDDVENWEGRFESLAESFGLNYTRPS